MKPTLTALFFSCMFFCCSHSFAQNNNDAAAKEMLCSGKWNLLVNEQGGKLLALSQEDQNAYIQFKGDGTLVSGIGGQEEAGEQGEWKLVNNKIIIVLKDDTRVYRFSIKNKSNKQYLYATFDVGDGPVTKVMIRNNSR